MIGNKYPNPYTIEKGGKWVFNDEGGIIETIPDNPDDFED